VGNSDPYGNWPKWLEAAVAVGVGVAVVAAVVASAVVTGPIGIAVANVAPGTSLGAAATNVQTAYAGAIFDYGANGYASTDIAQSGIGITPFTQTESNFATAFFGVVDDIIAYTAADEL